MKYIYIAVQIHEPGGNYAYVVRCTSSDNLLSKLRIRYLIAANIMPTRKAARDIVEAWNASFKRNGTYLFDTMPDGSPAPF